MTEILRESEASKIQALEPPGKLNSYPKFVCTHTRGKDDQIYTPKLWEEMLEIRNKYHHPSIVDEDFLVIDN